MESPEVLEIIDNQVTVDAKDLYRVILHRGDGSSEIMRELVPIHVALSYCNTFNWHWSPGGLWCEAIDYERVEEREKLEAERDRMLLYHEERLEEMEAERRKPGLVRRLAARAAAFIW